MAGETGKTVLVVDDEPDVRQYLRTLLADAGFAVLTAGDGQEALELLRGLPQPPDFISLDLVMPKHSGRRLLAELQKDRRWAKIPVLIVTAHARDELGRPDLDHLLDSRVLQGPGAWLEKPVKPRDYVNCVRRALGLAEDEEVVERAGLRDALRRELDQAGAAGLRRALAALRPAGADNPREKEPER